LGQEDVKQPQSAFSSFIKRLFSLKTQRLQSNISRRREGNVYRKKLHKSYKTSTENMKRKDFLRNSAIAGGSIFLPSSMINAIESPLFEAEEIDEFVGAAHGNLEETRKILEAKPLILNCASQIAKGDFETAIGGASHMGRRDIAELLVAHGARLDIFNFAFLGFTGFVKDLLHKYPRLLTSYGPHGFTLLHHAKVGGHLEFVKWLQDQGLSKEIFDDIFDF